MVTDHAATALDSFRFDLPEVHGASVRELLPHRMPSRASGPPPRDQPFASTQGTRTDLRTAAT